MKGDTRERRWAGAALTGVLAGGAMLAAAGCGRRETPVRPDVAVVAAVTGVTSASARATAASAGAMARQVPTPPGASTPAASAVPAGLLRGEPVLEALWLPGDGRLAAITERGARLFDPKTGQRVDVLGSDGVTSAALSIGGDVIALLSRTSLQIHGTSDGALRRAIALGPGEPTADASQPPVAISRDGQRVAVAGQRLRVWSVADGAVLVDIENPCSQTWQFAFHDDGQRLVLVSSFNAVVFDLARRVVVGEDHSTDTGGTFVTTVSPDGRWVVAASEAGHSLRLWRTHPWQAVRSLARIDSCEHHLGASFSPDGHLLRGVSYGAWQRDYEVGSWRQISPAAGALEVDDEATPRHARDARTHAVVAEFEGKIEGTLDLSNDSQLVVETRPTEVVLRSMRTGKIVTGP